MDINVLYERILSKLRTSRDTDIIENLDKSAYGAVTGNEALIAMGLYLLSLKEMNPGIYKLLKSEIKEFRKYCKQNGILL